jgi:hypothetical protein
MPKIKLSPELPDSFVEMDWRDSAKDPVGFSETLVRRYEDGQIIILRNSPISADYELLNRILLPPGRRYKKMGDHLFEWPRLRADSWGLHAQLLKDHPRDYLAVRREIRRASATIREWTQQVFSNYRITGGPCSWRFTPTGHEHMHIDSFGSLGDEPEKWYIRLFLNVDYQPRQWRVSHTLESLASTHYERAGMADWREGRGSDFCREMSSFVFGSKSEPVHDTQPYHEIEWETGDVWLVDTRMQSHQVVSGRRMMATGFEVDPSSMQDPSKSLDQRVKVYHEKHPTQA